jgi:hypothetical protein
MKKLPKEIEDRIPSHLQVVWWGRRSALEVIPEWSIAIWRTIVIFFVARWLWLAGLGRVDGQISPQFILGVFLCWLVFALSYAVFEQTRWRREIYVVARDIVNDNSKGQVFRFTGSHILQAGGSYSAINDPITSSWPSISLYVKQWEAWWGKITGQQLTRVFLDNPSSKKVFVSGNLMHPDFVKTILRLQGEVPSRYRVEDNEAVATLREIRELVKDGLLEFGEARTLIYRILS